MNVLDHISLGVPSIVEGTRFYTPIMSALGLELLVSNEQFAAYGKGFPQFLLMVPRNGAPSSHGNGCHVAFVAGDTQAVDDVHRYALLGGGQDEGAPGPRPDYPKPGVYAAFIRDPFGNKLEAIHNGFAV